MYGVDGSKRIRTQECLDHDFADSDARDLRVVRAVRTLPHFAGDADDVLALSSNCRRLQKVLGQLGRVKQ